MVSVHQPEGSAQRYVITLPGELFPAETAKVREVRAGVLAFFEQSLRPLFAAPATTPR